MEVIWRSIGALKSNVSAIDSDSQKNIKKDILHGKRVMVSGHLRSFGGHLVIWRSFGDPNSNLINTKTTLHAPK